MSTIKVKTRIGVYECNTNLGKYPNGNTCLSLSTVDGLPFANLTVNLGEIRTNEAFLDTNNSPFVQYLMKEYNLGEYAEYNQISGWVVYPLYKLNLDEIKKYTKKCLNT